MSAHSTLHNPNSEFRIGNGLIIRIHFGMDEPGERCLDFIVININQFKNLRLHGGFIIKDIELTDEPIMDAIGREAIAQTSAIARELRLLIHAGLSEGELSVTLYHEILEAASVAIANPPAGVMDFNEADFEQAARDAHERWGNASPANLNLLLQFHKFRGE
jgi:hypothetical protein